MFSSHFRRVLAFAIFVFALSMSVAAQDLDDVTVSGKIVDSNNLAIAGATVTATSIGRGEVRTVTTDDDGKYIIVKLKPGTYKIKATAPGFGAQETPEIITVSGQGVQQEFKLSPADVRAEQTVTVTADDQPVIDTTRTVVGGTITEREIEEIPNNSRNPLDLVLTLGGTSEEQLSTNGLSEDRNQSPATAPLEQGNFSLSGGVAYSNNLTIDGLDNNDDRSSRDRFQPSLESIAEVQVITNQFSAEYGRASGGRINIRTRAGNNKFRGRAFMFFRDEALNANTYYNNSRRLKRLPLSEYVPGLTFSGPVRVPFYNGRNKTFFAVAYEQVNLRDTTFIDTFVPITGNPRFPLPASTGPCPPAVPSCTDSQGPIVPIGAFTDFLATPSISHIFTARVDHTLTEANNFTVGYQYGRRKNRRTAGASVTRLDDALQSRNADSDAINFTDNHIFGARGVNQFRAQYSIFEPSFETDDPLAPVIIVLYRNPITGGTQNFIAGNSTAGITGDATGFPQNRRETRYQFQNTATILAGRHSLKFGGDIMRVRSRALGLGDATGTFNFTGFGNFATSSVARFRQNFGTASDVENTYLGLFLNDEVKLASNLTLSHGVRYERESAVSDNNNFGPRIGVAWDPGRDGKSVIRFGAGLFYNRALLRTVADSIQNINGNLVSFDTNTIGTSAADTRRTTILTAISTRFPGTFASIDEIRTLLTTVCPTVVNPPAPCTTSTGFVGRVTSQGNPLRTVEPGLVIPESYQFNIGFERELFKGWAFEANYTINKSVHLWRDYNGNAPVVPAGFADFTQYLLASPFQFANANGTIRTYQFVLGPRDATTVAGCDSFIANRTCTVNLNSTSTANTAPLASTADNFNATGSPIGIALAAVGRFRPDPTVSETSVIGSLGKAFYQGLILEMRSRYRKIGAGFGSSFRFAYTLSSTQDDGLNNTSNAEINRDFAREFAPNLQDRRHRIALSGTFDTPWWFGRLRLSPLFRYGSSGRFNLGNGGDDRNLDDLGTDRLNFSGDIDDIVAREPGSPIPTALISQFSLTPIGARGGNLPRNSGTSPSFFTFDLGVTREFRFRERFRLRPTVSFDNILNATVFNYGAGFIDYDNLTIANSTAQQNFLVPTRTYRQRQIRTGIRFDF